MVMGGHGPRDIVRNIVLSVSWNSDNAGPRVEVAPMQHDQMAIVLAAVAHVYAQSPIGRGIAETLLIERAGVSSDAIALLERAIRALKMNPQATVLGGVNRG